MNTGRQYPIGVYYLCKKILARTIILATLLCLHGGTYSFAQGCSSVCLPRRAFTPSEIAGPKFRFFVSEEYVNFDKFYLGSSPSLNPGGESGIFNILSVDTNIRITNRWSGDLIAPYVRKTHWSAAAGARTTQGLGDLAFLGNVRLTPETSRQALSARIGWKFANASVEEPSLANRLPNPFQQGSVTEDLLLGLVYTRPFYRTLLYANSLSRFPLTANKFDYRFGYEHRIQAGAEIPTHKERNYFTLLAGLSFEHAGHDTTHGTDVPAMILSGETVLNTGGTWLYYDPGLRIHLTPAWFTEARVEVPAWENWYGNSASSIGRARPGWRLALIFGCDRQRERH